MTDTRKLTERSATTVMEAWRRMCEMGPLDPMGTEVDGGDLEDGPDGAFDNPEAITTAFVEEFRGDLIETMRELARSDAAGFESNRDSLFSKIENLMRNSKIRELDAEILVGRGGDDDYVA